MTARRRTVGTGLTEKTSFTFDGGSDRDCPEIAAILETGTLDGLIASVERACFDILVDVGMAAMLTGVRANGSCRLAATYSRAGAWRTPSSQSQM